MFTGRLKHEIPLALDAFVDVLLDKVFYMALLCISMDISLTDELKEHL